MFFNTPPPPPVFCLSGSREVGSTCRSLFFDFLVSKQLAFFQTLKNRWHGSLFDRNILKTAEVLIFFSFEIEFLQKDDKKVER